MIDLSPIHDFIRKGDLIDKRPHKIHDLAAVAAYDVVVPGASHLKPGQAFRRLDPVDEPMVCQGGERPVDRVQRNRGQSHPQALVQCVSRGMVCRREQFAIDFQALMGSLQSCLMACEFKGTQLFLQ